MYTPLATIHDRKSFKQWVETCPATQDARHGPDVVDAKVQGVAPPLSQKLHGAEQAEGQFCHL
jgi:hypothetical protein